jgi:hypothetical protein
LEKDLGKKLPVNYVSFLMEMNGGEGSIGSSYLILWPAEEIVEINEAYNVSDWAPGVVIFGSDGGGEAYGFDFNSEEKT